VLVSGLDEAALDGMTARMRGRHRVGERWRIEVDEGALGALVQAVESAHGRILSVSPVRQSLEDYFFKEMAAEERQAWTFEE
jgi:hypothetical protein